MASSAGDSLESVERSLAFSSLILLPYSNRAATAAASSWEFSLESLRVLGLLLDSTGVLTNTSSKPESRGVRGVSGLDDEDCLGLVLTVVGGCLAPWPPALVISLRCRSPGWASALGGEDPS